MCHVPESDLDNGFDLYYHKATSKITFWMFPCGYIH